MTGVFQHLKRGCIKHCILSAGIWLAASAALAQTNNLPVLGDSVSGVLTTQQEYELGREMLRSFRAQAETLEDPLMEEYITSLTYHLAANSQLLDHRLEFILVDSEQLNAFAAPGGIIGVNAGLFTYAETEGQFASVIAHELAHVSQRHYARRILEAQSSSITNIAGVLASILIIAAGGGDAGTAALGVTQTLSLENQLRFSRNNEQEADRVGIRTLYDAGFDPDAMAEMFENMMRMRTGSQRIPEFLSSHPLDENRVADSRNRANAMPQVENISNVEYLLMRQRALLLYNDDYEFAEQSLRRQLPQLNGAEADAAQYGIALAQLYSGQFVAATESMAPLLAKDPNRITYVVMEAEIASTAGNYDQALQILENHLDINPNNYPLSFSYAQTLEQAGRYREAVATLEDLSEQRPTDINIWYHLAELRGLTGDISGVHQARAEYFFGIGEFGRARDHLNLALAERNDSLTTARIRQRLEDIRRIGDRFYR